MGNLYDQLDNELKLTQGLLQLIDEYHELKGQVARVKAAINRIDNAGLHNTADVLRDALAGGSNG